MKSRQKATSPQATSVPAAQMRVAAYIRVSTDDQKESGLGLKDQIHRTSAMASVKGWPEPTLYRDDGISGTKGLDKRPGLASLVSDIEAGKIDAVIVLDLSRLARKTRLVLDLVERMTEHGTSLISCKEGFDTTTPQGQFVLTLFAALAQLERDQIGQRIKGALEQLAREGKDRGGRMPYGYRRLEDGLEVVEELADVVREIFFLRRVEGMAYRGIADVLNDRNVTAPRGGGKWYGSSVYEVILNEEAYLGGSRGEAYTDWPAILEIAA